MRRLRLGAPRLSGRGMGLDPNTVAEYLDNSLAPDRVADFEKVCLESDVHLAEVGSCHQILAIVLGEAADVEPSTRERMYRLADRVQQQQKEKDKEPAAAAEPAIVRPRIDRQVAAVAPRQRRKAEVPAYLRSAETERAWLKPAAVVGLTALLLIVLLMAIDGSWLAERLGLEPSRPTTNAVVASNGTTPSAQTPDIDSASPTQEKAPADAHASAAAPTSELKQPESIGRVTPQPAPQGAEPAAPLPREAPATPEPATKPAETSTRPVTTPAAKPTETQPVPPRPAMSSVGRLVSTNEVLLRIDPQSNGWQRVPAQEMLNGGQKFVALPAFRPNITLANGITLELLGGTSAELDAIGEDGVPGVQVEFGRIVVLTPGRPDARLKVTAGGKRLQIAFGDAGTSMALEVRPVRAEGADPEAGPPQLQIPLYVASGKLTVADAAAGLTRDVEGPAVVSLGGVQPAGDDLPEWIGMDRLSPTERIGAEFLADNLTLDRPALLSLKELAEHRRVEVRTLAVQCLACLGDFDPLVAALNQSDPTFKSIWIDLIIDLRAAIGRGPDTAAKVRQAFERQRGEKAVSLYRMLWGYSVADLRSNDGKALKELVENLDHPDVDFRVLAFRNLHERTGLTLSYLPHQNAEQRKTHVQKWRSRLENGQILPKPE